MSTLIHILLVDDHASTREPLAFMLEQEPDLSVVAQAGCLGEARRMLGTLDTALDVAILDLGLPDGSGEELIADLRRVNPETATLILTYFSEQDRLARAVAAGASGILHKSSPVMEVVEAVRRLHRGEQLLTFAEVVDALQALDRERRQERGEQLPFEDLTEREFEVLQALAEGLSDREIAERLFIGQATVRTHVTNILAKLGAASRLQALVLSVRHNIVSID